MVAREVRNEGVGVIEDRQRQTQPRRLQHRQVALVHGGSLTGRVGPIQIVLLPGASERNAPALTAPG
jgi:hypothetical protein